jgi:hypothetical protein
MKISNWFFAVSIALCISAIICSKEYSHWTDVQVIIALILSNVGGILTFASCHRRMDDMANDMIQSEEGVYRHIDRRIDDLKSINGKMGK